MAYEAFHPELCERRVSKRRKQELVVYRLPDGSEPSGYAEMSVPADYADSSHVVPSVFISGTGGDSGGEKGRGLSRGETEAHAGRGQARCDT